MGMTKEEKLEQLKKGVLKEIKKQHGEGSAIFLGDESVINVERIPSGSFKLDKILGGGYPVGRVIEIYGPESSGKSTMAWQAVSACQKEGKVCAYVDVEHATNPQYVIDLGVDLDEIVFSQPDSGEQALDIVEQFVSSGVVDLVVVDSVAALVPQAELDGEMGDQQVGLQARLMSKAMRKLIGAMNKSKCTVIFINQIREKVGIMFGNPETTTGGRALKFYSSVRLEVRKKDAIKEGSEAVGHKLAIKTVKNKVAPPMKSTEVDLIYGKGIDFIGELIDIGIDLGLIGKSGSWFSYEGDKIGQGREAAKRWLAERPDVIELIKEGLNADNE